MISSHTITARAYIPPAPGQPESFAVPLAPVKISISRDADRAPYIGATLVIHENRQPVIDMLDPLAGEVFVIFDVTQSWGQADTLAGISAAFTGQSLAAVTDEHGAALRSISETFGVEWNSWYDYRPPFTRTVTLLVRKREIDIKADQVTLSLASREVVPMGYALLRSKPFRANTSSARAVVDKVLRIMGEQPALGTANGFVDVDATVWEPGVTAWDFLTPLLQSAGLRLYADESQNWILESRQSIVPGNLALLYGVAPLTAAVGSADMDEDYYDAVIVKYTWRVDGESDDRVRYDMAQLAPGVPRRVLTLEYDVPYPGAGAAKRVLRKARTKGNAIEASVVSDYSVDPGMTVTISWPYMVDQSGQLTATTWNFPENEMTVETRGVAATPPNAWVNLPSGLSWADIPVGISWTELDQLIPKGA